jgi:hypothetical protein
MVSLQVPNCVLPIAVLGLMEILDDLDASRLRVGEVRVHILDEHGKGLRSETQFRRRGSFPASHHYVRLAEMDLRTADRVAVAIVLDESERVAQPCQGFREVSIGNVGQEDIRGDGAIRNHSADFSPGGYPEGRSAEHGKPRLVTMPSRGEHPRQG